LPLKAKSAISRSSHAGDSKPDRTITARLRLAYLGVTNMFALLRLLPASDRDKDVEILALHHQIAVLERQLV
jgi:hypothetical protein